MLRVPNEQSIPGTIFHKYYFIFFYFFCVSVFFLAAASEERRFFSFHEWGISVYEPSACRLYHRIQSTDIIPGTQVSTSTYEKFHRSRSSRLFYFFLFFLFFIVSRCFYETKINGPIFSPRFARFCLHFLSHPTKRIGRIKNAKES